MRQCCCGCGRPVFQTKRLVEPIRKVKGRRPRGRRRAFVRDLRRDYPMTRNADVQLDMAEPCCASDSNCAKRSTAPTGMREFLTRTTTPTGWPLLFTPSIRLLTSPPASRQPNSAHAALPTTLTRRRGTAAPAILAVAIKRPASMTTPRPSEVISSHWDQGDQHRAAQ
jgi:hypothetical protein